MWKNEPEREEAKHLPSRMRTFVAKIHPENPCYCSHLHPPWFFPHSTNLHSPFLLLSPFLLFFSFSLTAVLLLRHHPSVSTTLSLSLSRSFFDNLTPRPSFSSPISKNSQLTCIVSHTCADRHTFTVFFFIFFFFQFFCNAHSDGTEQNFKIVRVTLIAIIEDFCGFVKQFRDVEMHAIQMTLKW